MSVPIDEVKEFHKRWDITYDDEQNTKRYLNRLQNIVYSIDDRAWRSVDSSVANYLGVDVCNMWQKRELFPRLFGAHKYSLRDVMAFVQALIWSFQDRQFCAERHSPSYGRHSMEDFKALYAKIKRVTELSNIQVEFFKNTSSGYISIYPAGAKLLDDKLVNDPLEWLADYPEVARSFSKALEHYMQIDTNPAMARTVADDMRHGLEAFMKDVLGNDIRIEDQAKELAKWLKARDVDPKLASGVSGADLIGKILNCYCKYQNDNIKHPEGRSAADPRKISKPEVEYVIYQTGLFIRFVIQVKRDCDIASDKLSE